MRVVAGAVAAVAVLSLGACSLLQPLDELDAGTGGATSTSSAGGAGGGEPLGDECAVAGDCAPPLSACIEVACERGFCVYGARANLTPLASQTPGNCLEKVCDGEGGEKDLFVEDPLDDGNDCTVDACVNGEARNTARQAGEACAEGVCDALAKCVECVPDDQLDPTSAQCDPAELCLSGKCSPPSCDDDLLSPNEGDVDCGGPCPPCADGATCGAATDCQSGVCDTTLDPPRCAAPSCDDEVQNGDETDVDCGAGCAKCGTGEGCVLPTDCESGVCFGGSCKAPTCTDGVRNGTETDVDCGGGGCGGCLSGKKCGLDTDCAGVLRCDEGLCVHPCADGERNFQETDVDCGGPLCAPCGDGLRCKCKTDCKSVECCSEDGATTCTKAGTCRGTLPVCQAPVPETPSE